MIKKILIQLLKVAAIKAVEAAEENFGAGRGVQKKKFAINYVLARVSMPAKIRELLQVFLVELAGEAVELAHSKLFKVVSS